MTNEIPRRARIDLAIPAETAIRAALSEVERLGAHPGLTNIVIKLGEALNETAEWYDNGAPGAYRNVSLIDQVRGDQNVSERLKDALTP